MSNPGTLDPGDATLPTRELEYEHLRRLGATLHNPRARRAGCVVRHLRREAGLSRRQLAERANLPEAFVQFLEHEVLEDQELTERRVAALAQALGVRDPEDLALPSGVALVQQLKGKAREAVQLVGQYFPAQAILMGLRLIPQAAQSWALTLNAETPRRALGQEGGSQHIYLVPVGDYTVGVTLRALQEVPGAALIRVFEAGQPGQPSLVGWGVSCVSGGREYAPAGAAVTAAQGEVRFDNLLLLDPDETFVVVVPPLEAQGPGATARTAVGVPAPTGRLAKWVSALWIPPWVGQPATAAEIPEQTQVFYLEDGAIRIACDWRAAAQDTPATMRIAWRVNLSTPSDLWVRFTQPDTATPLAEVRLGTALEGEEIFTQAALGFDPARDSWALAVILREPPP